MANIIDSNTIFCLRGDSYLDISSSPMTTNSNQENFPAITNKQLVFTGNTTDSSFIFGTTKTLPGDFTFEAWFNAQSYEGFNLFANRATETCFIIGHRTATETRIGTWIGPKDTWGKPSAHYFGSITMNTNNHMAYVRKGTTHYTFLNGKLISTVTVSSPPTLGLNNFNIGQTANFKVWNARISNVARYTADFTPDPSPYTSVAISEFSYTDGTLNLVVTKNTNETIHKIEVLVNGSIVKTYNSQTLNFGDTIVVDDYLIYGANTIEVKAYYYDNNYFISKSLSIEKSIEKLTNDATFEDIMEQTDKIKSNVSSMNNLLAATLASKGITTGSNPKMFHLIKLVGQMSNVNNSEVTGYLNQISELTSQNNTLTSQLSDKDLEIENNKLALVNALTAKNIECSVDEEYSSLIGKINNLSPISKAFTLYERGVFNISMTNLLGKSNSATITRNSDHIYLNGPAGSWIESGVVNTNTFDWSKYTKLYVDFTVVSTSHSSATFRAVFSTAASRPTAYEGNFSNAQSLTTYGKNGQSLLLTVDLTAAPSGFKWIYLHQTYTAMRIYKIWVE